MAQRTGDQRFLARAAKTTSARLCLALVGAVFVAGGCGGSGSSEDSTTTAAGSAAAGSRKSAEAEAVPKNSSTKTAQRESGSADSNQPSNEPPTQGGKHGRHIVQPTGGRERAPTPKEIANSTIADMTLQSPAIVASGTEPGAISSVYTCDGKDSWPALSWQGVPAGTAELVLYVMNVQPVEEKLFVDWAVAGLDPGLTSIEAGHLPKGVVIGTNSFGKRDYEICPTGEGEIYMFALYALPKHLSLSQGFDARETRHDVLDVSGDVGLLAATYVRG